MATAPLTKAENGSLSIPKTIEAGNAFSIQSTGNGKAILYIIGPTQVIRRDVKLGEITGFPADSLFNAGHYLVILVGSSFTINEVFDVVPASKPANLSFLAKPSRLQVGLHDGISGSVYVFDAYKNLISVPVPISFELTNPSHAVQKHTVITRNGVAWTRMDSTAQQGIGRFESRIGDVASTRIVEQVPGDPCRIKMNAQRSGNQLQLTTEPVRDCNSNAVPDGTIVTFTSTYPGGQLTVDVPLKLGIATVIIPAHTGALITVASGVVLGNQIHWN
jgi:hypothetical protein